MQARKGIKKTRVRPPLRAVYDALLRHFGPQEWWPGRTRLEIIVGAILTQNTAWSNVERAITRLRKERALNFRRLHSVPLSVLAEWIRSAGYFRIKAERLRAFTTWLQHEFHGDLRRMFLISTSELRTRLLQVKGIGPETADSILLYAGNRPVFVVDAYTRRFLQRHRWIRPDVSYDGVAKLFTRSLPRDTTLFNEFHALIVAVGKNFCRSKPLCDECPLRSFLPNARTTSRKETNAP